MIAIQTHAATQLDLAYQAGRIAFVSADNLLIPVRERADIFVTDASAIAIHFAGVWLIYGPDQIKFIRRQ